MQTVNQLAIEPVLGITRIGCTSCTTALSPKLQLCLRTADSLALHTDQLPYVH
jgi:hypothetical protein